MLPTIAFTCLALLAGCAGELKSVRSHYESGWYALLDTPQDKYCIEQFGKAIAAAEALLQNNEYNRLEHDTLISLLCLSQLGTADYFRQREDFLAEEENYLLAIRTAAGYGKHLPFQAGPIYQGKQSVYRQELIKRDCYLRLASMYDRLDEPALACIVRMQWAFSHAYLLSSFAMAERRSVERYELYAQDKMDSSFRNDVVSGVLMFFATLFYIAREATIQATHIGGGISKERAEELSAEAFSDYERALEKIEAAHERVEMKLDADFQDMVLLPLTQSMHALEQFPFLEKLDAYQELRALAEQIKQQARSNYSSELVSLLGKYQSGLDRLYRQTRTSRNAEIRAGQRHPVNSQYPIDTQSRSAETRGEQRR